MNALAVIAVVLGAHAFVWRSLARRIDQMIARLDRALEEISASDSDYGGQSR